MMVEFRGLLGQKMSELGLGFEEREEHCPG